MNGILDLSWMGDPNKAGNLPVPVAKPSLNGGMLSRFGPSAGGILSGLNNYVGNNRQQLIGMGMGLLTGRDRNEQLSRGYQGYIAGSEIDRVNMQRRQAEEQQARNRKANANLLRVVSKANPDFLGGIDPDTIANTDVGNLAVAGAVQSAFTTKTTKNRQIVKGPDNRNYYADTGEKVLPHVEAPSGFGKETFQNESTLRKEYAGDQQVQAAQKVESAYRRIRASVQSETGPSDIALIFNYMKMLDPGSVVREGEFATAANAGGVGQRVAGIYNRVVNGEKLTPEVRQQFIQSANSLYSASREKLDLINNRYSGIAGQYGLDPNNILYQMQTFEPIELTGATPGQPKVSGQTSSGLQWSVE